MLLPSYYALFATHGQEVIPHYFLLLVKKLAADTISYYNILKEDKTAQDLYPLSCKEINLDLVKDVLKNW